MTESHTRIARLSNYAMLASLILRSREEARYRAGAGDRAPTALERRDREWLERLRDLLLTSVLGAHHVTDSQFSAPQPSRSPERSLSDELEIYDVVMDLNRSRVSDPEGLVSWVNEATGLIDTVESKGWTDLEAQEAAQLDEKLLPFLVRLANLDGEALAAIGTRERSRPSEDVVAA